MIRIDKLFSDHLVINTSWMFIAQGFRTLIQAIYFILIARALGADQYGLFISIGAFVAIVSPFAGLGTGNLLIRNVSRQPDTFAECWGQVLTMTIITGFLLLLFVFTIYSFVLPSSIPFILIVLISIADIFFTQFVELSSQAFQAMNRLNKTALIQLVPPTLRLIAIVGLTLYVSSPTVYDWSCLYLITIAISASFGIWQVCRCIAIPELNILRSPSDIREGLYFAIGNMTANVYNDIDKTMLARLATLEAAGIYGAAYRIIEVAFIPIRSLLYATYPNYFKHGQTGIRGSLGFTRRILPYALAYCFIACLGLIMTAPLLPHILGHAFANATAALRWLSPLLFFKAIHYFAADTLTGANFQGIRTGVQVIIAVFNVLLNLWIIPHYYWHGAVISSLISDGLLVVLLWIAILLFFRKTVTPCVA